MKKYHWMIRIMEKARRNRAVLIALGVFALLLVSYAADLGIFRSGVFTIVRRDSVAGSRQPVIRIDVDSILLRAYLRRIIDSTVHARVRDSIDHVFTDSVRHLNERNVAPGTGGMYLYTDGTSTFWSAVPAGGGTDTLGNTVQSDCYVTYPNNGNDSTLVSFMLGFSATTGIRITLGRVTGKSSYNALYYLGQFIVTNPARIGQDSCYITGRLRGTAAGATRELVILKHAVGSAPLTPAITAGTEVARIVLDNAMFPSAGTGSVTLKFTLWFNRRHERP